MTKCSVCLTMALAITYARQVPPDVPLAITPVTVIDVTTADSNAALKRNQTVIISGARITAVGPAGRTLVPPGARTIDGDGKFLIPGLWDMHAHVLGDDRLDYFPALFVANGVTGVRDAGSRLPPARIREIRTAISAGTTIGPRVGAVAGAILEGAGGRVTPQFLPIANLTEARAAVIAHKESGADFVKAPAGRSALAHRSTAEDGEQRGRDGVEVTGAAKIALDWRYAPSRCPHAGGHGCQPPLRRARIQFARRTGSARGRRIDAARSIARGHVQCSDIPRLIGLIRNHRDGELPTWCCSTPILSARYAIPSAFPPL